jgi:penicillin G amidase
MKILKKAGWVLLSLLTLLLLGFGSFLYTLTPDYSGEKELASLSDTVEVYFDDYGIPHIYADQEEDAFRALGYVHAQDRLWQMELLRRVASGGLSEVFGADLLSTDQFFLALGIDDASRKTVAGLDRSDPSVQLTEAYLDGINQFITEGPTPVEFYLTGLDKRPFELQDVYNAIGYMAFSFAMAHKTDPLLTHIQEQLGPQYLADLGMQSSEQTVWIRNHAPGPEETLGNSLASAVQKALGAVQLSLFEGSNSWVLAPEKTKNGAVIFTNDPHIGFSQPSVWYEAHLETPNYTKYGYHMAGIPFPLLGHDRQLAYGMTMFQNDDVNFYFEEIHPEKPGEYNTEEGWKPFGQQTRTIQVKDAAAVDFTYQTSHHGPILNGIAEQVTGDRPIAMSWVYVERDNQLLRALYEMSHAHDLESFASALPKVHAPGLNVMYGDAKGHVAWFATAQLYRVPDSINTKLVFEPGQGLPLDKEWLPFTENPQAVDPPWHYVYSANNQPDSIAGMLYPGYYLPENRAKRIVALLEPKNDWDRASAAQMMNDVTSSVDAQVALNLSKLIQVAELNANQLKALDTLARWKGNYPLNSVAGTIYTRWSDTFLKHTFQDELGEEGYGQFTATHLYKRLIAPMSTNAASVWWDNVLTPDLKESQQQIAQQSFVEAMAGLEAELGTIIEEWTWNKVHTLEHPHPIGQVAALRSFFNVGPFPNVGSREVINNMAFPTDGTGHYKTSAGPSTRRVIDFSDVENSISILPTGQSGNPLSKHYKDQAELYNQGGFRKMMMNKEEIQAGQRKLLLQPTAKE